MPFITALSSPFSSLKSRPLDNSRLEPSEIIKVPKETKLGVTFPSKDSDQKIQAVRLVGDLSTLGLKAGDIYFAYINEWLVNDTYWNQIKPKKNLVTKNLKSIPKKYTPSLKEGDYWLQVRDYESENLSEMVCFEFCSVLKTVWKKDCLAKGQTSDWTVFSGDTPVGLYKLGHCWIAEDSEISILKPYGKYCFDMISIEDAEIAVGRSGICLHGGGSNLGYPKCVEPYQPLVPTFGCIRAYNQDLATVIYDLWLETQANGNDIWITVIQS